jgi:hypothetical protein
MDFELKHLGQTLALGGLAVYGIIFLLRIYTQKMTPNFFKLEAEKISVFEGAVYLALIFAAGIIIEDFSKNVSAQRPKWISKTVETILEADKSLRLRSLYNVHVKSDASIIATATPLLKNLLAIDGESATYRRYKKPVLEAMTPGTDVITIQGKANVDLLMNSINGMYYSAKNVVYTEDNFFEELSEIGNRTDFVRGLTLLCVAFFCGYLAFIAAFIWPAFRVRNFPVTRKEIGKVFAVCLLYFFGVWATRLAYTSECTNYNLRVFGYYITLVEAGHAGGIAARTN